VEQLDEEGVVQVQTSDRRGVQAPVFAAVGPMQFDVVIHRMEHEFSAPVHLDFLPYTLARLTDQAGADALNGSRIAQGEAMTRTKDGATLALFPDKWKLGTFERTFPDAHLEPLIAAHE
jgi:peptide chain release factor 3